MDSDRFRQLIDAPGPFASVYFDDLPENDDVDAQLGVKLRDLREQLEQQGADESIAAEIQYAITGLGSPIGRGGRAVIAGAKGVIVNEYLLGVGEPVVRVSELPYIVPIVEHGIDRSRYLLVVADASGAFITSHTNVTRLSETVEGNGRRLREINEQTSPDPCPVADRISELVDDKRFDAVFLVGDVDLRSALLAALPEPVRQLAISLPIQVHRGGYDFEEIQRAVDTTVLQQRLSVMDTATARFSAELGRASGLAAEGLGAVCSALCRGTVDTMIIGDMDDTMVVTDEDMTTVAPNPAALAEQGATPAKTVRADEALPLLAISGGASLVCTDERIAPADGICAVLRSGTALRRQAG